MTGQSLYTAGPLSQIILFIFLLSVHLSFPSSNLKDLTEYAFLKEMKSVHSRSNKWKYSTNLSSQLGHPIT